MLPNVYKNKIFFFFFFLKPQKIFCFYGWFSRRLHSTFWRFGLALYVPRLIGHPKWSCLVWFLSFSFFSYSDSFFCQNSRFDFNRLCVEEASLCGKYFLSRRDGQDWSSLTVIVWAHDTGLFCITRLAWLNGQIMSKPLFAQCSLLDSFLPTCFSYKTQSLSLYRQPIRINKIKRIRKLYSIYPDGFSVLGPLELTISCHSNKNSWIGSIGWLAVSSGFCKPFNGALLSWWATISCPVFLVEQITAASTSTHTHRLRIVRVNRSGL